MNTQFYKTRMTMIVLLFGLLLSGCSGTRKDPMTGQMVKADLKDLLAAAFGWNSWDDLAYGGGSVLISISNDTEGSEFVLAFPENYALGSVGDGVLSSMLTAGAADAIGDGQVFAARLRTSLYSIQQAFSGNPNAQIWLDTAERYLVTFLPNGGNAWFMGVVDLKTRSMFQYCQALQNCGSFMNARTATELAQAMRDNGWKLIPASQVPAGVKNIFLNKMGFLDRAWFVRLQGAVASPMILPVGAFLVPQSILLPDSIDWDEMPQR